MRAAIVMREGRRRGMRVGKRRKRWERQTRRGEASRNRINSLIRNQSFPIIDSPKIINPSSLLLTPFRTQQFKTGLSLPLLAINRHQAL